MVNGTLLHDEKSEPQATESGSNISTDTPQPLLHIERKVERSLVRKLDLLVMPLIGLAYFTHTLDRANIGNAKTDGLEKDIGLKSGQYSLVLTYFYIPYALAAIPLALLAKRFHPGNVIPILMLIWGAMATAAAYAKGFGDLVAFRIIIGLAEAGFKPSVMYYFATFYTRKEVGLRMGSWGVTGFIAGAVSGLISWDVFQWSGKPLWGWQYLFIIEGSITMGIAIFAFFLLPRDIENSRWFTKEEASTSAIRYENEFPERGRKVAVKDILKALLNWEVWAFSFMALLYGVGQASSSNFLPSIVKRLTISTPKANLYTIGPNLVGAVTEVSWCWLSDHYQQRGLVSSGAMIFAVVGFICLATVNLDANSGAGYFFTYLIEIGTFTSGALIPAWASSNLPNATTRATALGMIYAFTNLAGIISSETFRTQDAPVYKLALIVTASFQAVFVVVGLAMRQYYIWKNKQLDEGKLSHVEGMEHNVEFRYAI